MEPQASLIEALFTRIESYSKTTLELTKLRALNTTTNVATSFISWLIVLLIIALFAFIFSIGIALYLGDLLDKPYLGFIFVAAFYLVVGLLFYIFLKQWIKKPISAFIISQFQL